MRALVLASAISACDLPLFFSTPSDPPECNYQIDVRCSAESFEGLFGTACRPELNIDGCDFRVDAQCEPAFTFEGRITETGIETDDCIAHGFDVECGRCRVTFVEDEPPPYVLGESFCATPDCDALFQEPLYDGALRYGLLRVGWMPEIFAEERTGYVLNTDFRSGIDCPFGDVLVGFVGDSERRPGQMCLHRIERTPFGYLGVYGDVDLRLGRFDFTLQLEKSMPLSPVVGAMPASNDYSNHSMAYDPATGLVGLAIGSTVATHLLVVDAEGFELVANTTLPMEGTPQEPLNYEIAGMASAEDGWIYVDDLYDVVVKTAPRDLGATRHTSPALRDLRASSSLGPLVVGRPGVFEGGILVINMAAGRDEIILARDTPDEIAVLGSARTLTDTALTPTALAWAGDLVAVGLFDRLTEKAYVGFFDPVALRFLPGTIEVGMGVVAQIREAGDRLWVGLSWQGKIVELKQR